MPINTNTINSGVNDSDKPKTSDALNAKTGEETQEAASLNVSSKEQLLRAQQSALEAKEAALGAISRFYEESKVSETKAGKMFNELEEALQLAIDANRDSIRPSDMPHDKNGSKASRKILNAGNPFVALKKSLFGAKPTETEVKEEFYRQVMRKSPQLRQLIDDLTDDKASAKIDKTIELAKSEIAAARVAVSKTQQEINTAREEAQKAHLNAENTRKAAELIISRIKQVTLSEAAAEIAEAQQEMRAAKNAADKAIKRAEEEIRKNCEEAAAIDKNAQVTVTLANEKIARYAEELRAYKVQAHIAVNKARDEASQAKEAVETARREAREAIEKAALERQQAEADKDTARRMMQEATAIAETKQYDQYVEEIKKMRREVDTVNQQAQQAIAKANRECQAAREELDMMKKASNDVVNTARHQADTAREKAEKAEQAVFDIADQSQQENRKLRQEAEASRMKASEAMSQAKKDIISITRDEIAGSKQELESPGKSTPPALDAGRMASVLHEMRNPLHSICGFAKLLKEEDVSDDNTRKEFLAIMEQQSESLNKLIDDLSHILNDENGVEAVNTKPVSPYTMITEAIDSVQTIAQQKKNMISHNLTPDLPVVDADAFRIKQVIVNLLTNAIKFGYDNRPILVSARVRDGELLVQVIDHGIGIPAVELDAVFNKNYRAKNCGEVAGEGLGLYICREIINDHGGKIWAESVEGEGSTFCLSLPVTKTAQQENNDIENSNVSEDSGN